MLARDAAKGRVLEAAVVDLNGLLSPGQAPPLARARDRQLARKHRTQDEGVRLDSGHAASRKRKRPSPDVAGLTLLNSLRHVLQ